MIHIDSGSTDATVDTIRLFHPQKLIQIEAHEYVPGVVLNRGMREASSPWVIFLNSDCTPVNHRWLSETDGGGGSRAESRRGFRPAGAAARIARRCTRTITTAASATSANRSTGTIFSAWPIPPSGAPRGRNNPSARTCNIPRTTNGRAVWSGTAGRSSMPRNRWSCIRTTTRYRRRSAAAYGEAYALAALDDGAGRSLRAAAIVRLGGAGGCAGFRILLCGITGLPNGRTRWRCARGSARASFAASAMAGRATGRNRPRRVQHSHGQQEAVR